MSNAPFIIVLFALFFLLGPMGLFGWTRARIKRVHQNQQQSFSSPYREPAKVESYESEVKEMPIKKKREPIVLPKSIIVFMLLVPAMLVDIGLGFAYDSAAIGVGAKWGMLAAAILTNIFFIVCAISKAEEKK